MDPNVGRFTSEDPLGFVDGANVYGYVVNDPLSASDPLGLKWWKWGGWKKSLKETIKDELKDKLTDELKDWLADEIAEMGGGSLDDAKKACDEITKCKDADRDANCRGGQRLTIDRMNSNRTQYFDYDDVGNRTNLVDITGTTTNKTRSTHNAANRLTQTITGTLTNTFVYDAAGRLTNQVVGTRNRWRYNFRSQMKDEKTRGHISRFSNCQ